MSGGPDKAGMGRPKHVLGIPWGRDAGHALAACGLTGDDWQAWESDGAFVTCTSPPDAVQAFGAAASVCLVAADGLVEGGQLSFRDCASRWSALRAAVIAEYGLDGSASANLYEHWATGELVRLTHDRRDDTCRLTIAGPRFGAAYARYLLRTGVAELSGALRP
jgi:hypothetical protein